MTTEQNNGGPAFPIVGTHEQVLEIGMSLRDYFAAKVCASLLTTTSADHDYPNLDYQRDGNNSLTCAQRVARISYQMADAMLEARK